jgi:hypothetical protein
MRVLSLKAVATALTLVAAVGAAVQVSRHVKDAAAPLHPTVLGQPAVTTAAADGHLQLTPAVRGGDVRAVTSTYVS